MRAGWRSSRGAACGASTSMLHLKCPAPLQPIACQRWLISPRPSSRHVCHGINDFRKAFQSYEPGRSNQHSEPSDANDDEHRSSSPDAASPESSSQSPLQQQDQQQLLARDYSRLGVEPSQYVQQRLAAAGASDVPTQLHQVEAVVDQEISRWPRLVRTADGALGFYPGFLLLLLEPLPPEFILGSNVERVVQVVVFMAVAAVAFSVYQAVAAQNLNLALVLGLHWARNKLSAGRLLMISALAWFGNLWLYWLFFVGARIDDVLKRIASPIRMVMWGLFIGWLLYLAFAPIWCYPLPWLTFAPGNSALRGLNLMRVGG